MDEMQRPEVAPTRPPEGLGADFALVEDWPWRVGDKVGLRAYKEKGLGFRVKDPEPSTTLYDLCQGHMPYAWPHTSLVGHAKTLNPKPYSVGVHSLGTGAWASSA